MEQNKKLMEILVEKENIDPNNKRTNKVGRKWVYYQTYGTCGHTSKNCKFKIEGHQDDAMRNDRKGESTNHCMYASAKKQLQNSRWG